jgi:hypothetical protein
MSRSQQVVCLGCQKHIGGTTSAAILRDRQHVQMWQAGVSLVKEEHRPQVDGLERRIKELDQSLKGARGQVSELQGALMAGLDARPVESIARWFEHSKIAEADEKRRRASDFIERLFGILWFIDELHHEEAVDECSCGIRVDDCAICKALAPVRGKLNKWEAEQVARIRKGQRHSLPVGHPEVAKHESWRTHRHLA